MAGEEKPGCVLFEKVFTVLVVLVGICLTLYEVIVWGLMATYSRSLMPVSGGIGFPRLTICSRTILNASLMNPYPFNNDPNMRDYGLSLLMPSINPEVYAAAANVLTWSYQQQLTTVTNFQNYMNSLGLSPINVMLNYAYQCQGFLTTCWIGTAMFPCCNNAQTILTNVGPCTVIDTQQVQVLTGQRGAMNLKFVIDINNYLKFAGVGHPGFLLFFDDNEYFQQDPVPIQIGKETFVALNMRPEHRMMNIWGEINCAAPYRYFVSNQAGSAYGYGYSYNTFGTGAFGTNYIPGIDNVDCARQCMANYISQTCGCYPLPMVSRSFSMGFSGGMMAGAGTVGQTSGIAGAGMTGVGMGTTGTIGGGFGTTGTMYATRYCQINDSLMCVDPLMNGSQPMSFGGGFSSGYGGGTYGRTTQWITLDCERQCPIPCVQLHADPSSVSIVDLHPNFWPDQRALIPNQGAMVHLYYNSLTLNGFEMSPWHYMLYGIVREIGLSICIWFVFGFLLLKLVHWIVMASIGEIKPSDLRDFHQNLKSRFTGGGKVAAAPRQQADEEDKTQVA